MFIATATNEFSKKVPIKKKIAKNDVHYEITQKFNFPKNEEFSGVADEGKVYRVDRMMPIFKVHPLSTEKLFFDLGARLILTSGSTHGFRKVRLAKWKRPLHGQDQGRNDLTRFTSSCKLWFRFLITKLGTRSHQKGRR